jgi:hypothetical protein
MHISGHRQNGSDLLCTFQVTAEMEVTFYEDFRSPPKMEVAFYEHFRSPPKWK